MDHGARATREEEDGMTTPSTPYYMDESVTLWLGKFEDVLPLLGDVTFDFEPSGGVADEYLPTRRGHDERLDTGSRPRAEDRLAAKKARRRHE